MNNILTDMIISALLKKGILSEVKNFETDIEIPQTDDKKPIKIIVKAENVQIKFEKDEKDGK